MIDAQKRVPAKSGPKDIPALSAAPKIGTSTLLFCIVSVAIGLYFYNDTKNREDQKRERAQQQIKAAKAARAPKVITAAESLERDTKNREYAAQLEKDANRKAILQDTLTLNAIAVRFNDINQVAAVSPRIALAGPVQQMQAIRRDLEATPTHQCLVPAKAALTAVVASTTSAYLSFMESTAPDGSAQTKSHIENVRAHSINYQKMRDDCLTR